MGLRQGGRHSVAPACLALPSCSVMLSRLSAPQPPFAGPTACRAVWISQVLLSLRLPSHVSWFTPGNIIHLTCGKVLGTAQQVLAPSPSLSSSPCSLCLWPCVPAFLAPGPLFLKGDDFHVFFFLNAIPGSAKPENLSTESSRHLPTVTTAWPCQSLLTTKCSSLNRVKGGFAQVWRQPAAFVLTVPTPMFTQV